MYTKLKIHLLCMDVRHNKSIVLRGMHERTKKEAKGGSRKLHNCGLCTTLLLEL
jgi:hypothetical protein